MALAVYIAVAVLLQVSWLPELQAKCNAYKGAKNCPDPAALQSCIDKLKPVKDGSRWKVDVSSCFRDLTFSSTSKTWSIDAVSVQPGCSGKCSKTTKVCDTKRAFVTLPSGTCQTSVCIYAYSASSKLKYKPTKASGSSTCIDSSMNACFVCEYKNLQIKVPSRQACDDGNQCTVDRCNKAGKCTRKPISCQDDGDACTVEQCVNGKCQSTPLVCPDTDNNKCTDEKCVGGHCLPIPKSCDDFDVCTSDSCEVKTGTCQHAEIECGKCKSNTQCDDKNDCTQDVCDVPSGKCTNIPYTAEQIAQVCDDKKPCTVDTCSSSKCQNTPKTCDDKNPCTDDKCNDTDGSCTSTLITDKGRIDQVCNDGDLCTVPQCAATGCVQAPKCDDGNPCTDDTCKDGACNSNLIDDYQRVNQICDDKNPCTEHLCSKQGCLNVKVQEKYKAPQLEDIVRKVCNDNNACTTAKCTDSGCLQTNACDDGKPCTVDTCTDGVCKNTLFKDLKDSRGFPLTQAEVEKLVLDACEDNKPCTFGTCDWGTGNCVQRVYDGFTYGTSEFNQVQKICEDGNPCTYSECNPDGTCAQKLLNPSNREHWKKIEQVCDDGNPCTVPSCPSLSTGCKQTLLDNTDEDAVEEACPIGKYNGCKKGKCTKTGCVEVSRCDDGNECTLDFCEEKGRGNVECKNLNYDSQNQPAYVCNDYDPCTEDVCQLPNNTATAAECAHKLTCSVSLSTRYGTKILGGYVYRQDQACPSGTFTFTGSELNSGTCNYAPKCCVDTFSDEVCDNPPPTLREEKKAACPWTTTPGYNCFVLNTTKVPEPLNLKVSGLLWTYNGLPTCMFPDLLDLNLSPKVAFPELPALSSKPSTPQNVWNVDTWEDGSFSCNAEVCDALVQKKYGSSFRGVCCPACVPGGDMESVGH